MFKESGNLQAPTDWLDRDWQKLIASIEKHTVIPIIGQDLLEVQPSEAQKPVLLHRYVAEQLAEEYCLEAGFLSASTSLSDVVFRCLQEGADHFDISV